MPSMGRLYIYRSMNFVDIYGFHVGKHSIFPWILHGSRGNASWDPTPVPEVGSTSLLVTGSGTYRATLVLGYAIGKCLEGQISVFLWMIFGWRLVISQGFHSLCWGDVGHFGWCCHLMFFFGRKYGLINIYIIYYTPVNQRSWLENPANFDGI